ncbi:MATE efflux family isoform A [Micractinium conductrix]|uniref:Protein DETOXIFICATION n=1 Tax=Micractinium conductrix TaxID=554055 RepID=A0A2P6VAE7_9CHLO|nr:MATE efflux family isoform A [Micractinium conductrix]|eukprot:PSC71055.1 MATE efflux family isoform A [Micractinium conductrix]
MPAPAEWQARRRRRTATAVAAEGARALQPLPERPPPPATLSQELTEQAHLAGPLALNLIANYSLNIVSLSFVGKLGDTSQLAAAALGTSLSAMSGKIPLMGLCGAVDTLASQASGAGQPVGIIFQRATLFLMLHCLPIAAAFVSLPALLAALGQPAEVCALVRAYLLALLPNLFIDAVARPLNRILVAQRMTQPQMAVGLVVAVQHVAACWLCVHRLGMGYLGAAVASVWSNVLSLALLVGWVAAAGLGERVWGRPSREAFTGWRQFAGLAYASAAMKCIESWSFSLMNILSGWLPNAAQSVAAISVAFNLYGILFMGFSAFAMAASTRVGNSLGAGSASGARLAALGAALAAPVIWIFVAFVLTWPPSQAALLSLFTNGTDEVLLQRMRSLLYLVVVLELFDGAQTILSGIIGGVGKQKRGSLINVLAYWLCAVPVACLLGFWAKQGVVGFYSGMCLGPAIQTFAYLALILRLHWGAEADAAMQRVAAAT